MSTLYNRGPESYYQTFERLARDTFGVIAYSWQARVASLIMEQCFLNKECRVLCIQGTGAGKSVLYQTLAVYFRSVTIYISPLLTLGADQVNKLMVRTERLDPNVIPIHLDGMKTDAQMKHFIGLVKTVDNHASIIVFASPQTLTDRYPKFVGSIRKYIRFVVVDELHIYNAFGRSFREEFPKLKEKLFKKVEKDVYRKLY